jgi:ribosomal protein L37E
LTESAVTVKLHFDMDLVSDRQRQFEEYLRDGITAAKNGQRKLAWSLLNRASYLNNTDARPYMWLSRIADDPKERFWYLELALGLDPTDSAIRRELALLNGKLDPKELIPEGVERIKPPGVDEVQAEGHAFLCPRCGGRMTFEVVPELMTCAYCGYQEGEKRKSKHTSRSLAELADESEQEMDFILPTIAGHRWAQADQQLSCERCGALSLLPAGQKTLLRLKSGNLGQFSGVADRAAIDRVDEGRSGAGKAAGTSLAWKRILFTRYPDQRQRRHAAEAGLLFFLDL